MAQDDIVERSQALIDRIHRDLAATEEFYHAQGLDPEKVRSVLRASLTPQQEAAAQEAFEADLVAVTHDVEAGRARAALASDPAAHAVRTFSHRLV